MRLTVCELNDDPVAFQRDWTRLVQHVAHERSELVLLPEMPFYPWFGTAATFDGAVWRQAVHAHELWLARLAELAPATVIATRPVERSGTRLNEAFAWSGGTYTVLHHKYFLPNEEGFWEASWYSRGDGSFAPQRCGAAFIGVQICTELWALDQSRAYGKLGAHLIVAPRATPHATLEKWVVGGRAAAVCAGAFVASSNHVSTRDAAVHLGGQGWIIGPDGDVLALTSAAKPFATVSLDLAIADAAKTTYPRYVF